MMHCLITLLWNMKPVGLRDKADINAITALVILKTKEVKTRTLFFKKMLVLHLVKILLTAVFGGKRSVLFVEFCDNVTTVTADSYC